MLRDRRPLIIGLEDWAPWFGEELLADPAKLLKPFAAERMTMWPIDKRVGNVENQGRKVAEPIGEA